MMQPAADFARGTMFAWLRRSATGAFIDRETEKIVNSVGALSAKTRHSIATDLCREIVYAETQISSVAAAGNKALLDAALNLLLLRAKNLRHVAMERGAISWDDPKWASASLYEGWVLCIAGGTGKSTVIRVRRRMAAFLGDNLSPEELETIHAQMTGPDYNSHLQNLPS